MNGPQIGNFDCVERVDLSQTLYDDHGLRAVAQRRFDWTELSPRAAACMNDQAVEQIDDRNHSEHRIAGMIGLDRHDAGSARWQALASAFAHAQFEGYAT